MLVMAILEIHRSRVTIPVLSSRICALLTLVYMHVYCEYQFPILVDEKI